MRTIVRWLLRHLFQGGFAPPWFPEEEYEWHGWLFGHSLFLDGKHITRFYHWLEG